ncbi:MAG: hypothetical protein ACRD0I_01100 [Acidimicrobiales bacterium]
MHLDWIVNWLGGSDARASGSAYGYVGDNPLNGVDPSGLACGIFSFACSPYDQFLEGSKISGRP